MVFVRIYRKNFLNLTGSVATLKSKNIDVDDEVNFKIQQLLAGDIISFKTIDTVVNKNKIMNYQTEFFQFGFNIYTFNATT